MAHPFDPSALVELPVRGATATSTLAEQLISAAEAAPSLDKPLASALADVKKARHDLEKTFKSRLGGGGDPKAARDADLAEDNAWSATYDWARGWSKLPESVSPHSKKAVALLAVLFPDGLSFTQVPFL